jgi:PAS domain S-box-containing protein
MLLINDENARNNARLAAIIESSEDAIYAKDLDGIVTDWNKSAEEMYGYTAEEMIGKHISIIVPESRKHEVEEILQKIRAGERVQQFETQRVRKDGTILDVSISVSPMKRSDGMIFGAAAIARDVTKIHKMQTQIQESKEIREMFESAVGRELKMVELKSEIAKLKELLGEEKEEKPE